MSENNNDFLKDLATQAVKDQQPPMEEPPMPGISMDGSVESQMIQEEAVANTEVSQSVDEVSQVANDFEEDEAPIIMDAPKKEVPVNKAPTPVPVSTGLDDSVLNSPNIQSNPTEPVSDTDQLNERQRALLEEVMPDLDEDTRLERAKPIFAQYDTILKDLIMNGFSPEEASTAATNRMKRDLTKSYAEYKEEFPDIGVITIDKTKQSAEGLKLTPEEHAKLENVKRVRLISVTDAELKNVEIDRPDEEHVAEYIRNISGTLAKYDIPLPMFGDMVSFKGAQIVQMVNVVNYEDSTIDETVNTKASLIYDKLNDGAVLKKYDADGKNIMSYTEFVNKFPYQDIDMALYGILCASSMEESTTSLTCQSCAHVWDQTYSIKSLLKLDQLNDKYKKRIDDIIGAKGNEIKLRQIYEDSRKARRYKSPFTGNIYDLSYPSIARATALLRRIDQNDNVMMYLAAIGLYISKILVRNPATDRYVEVEADNTDLVLDTLQALTQDDIQMLATEVREEWFYETRFSLDVKCPSCGKQHNLPLRIEDLVFLKAQDSMDVIAG